MTATDFGIGICAQCGHPSGPHGLVATNGEPTKGGIMLCPVSGCQCLATWDVPPYSSRDEIVMPTEEEVDILRQALQNPIDA